MGYVGITIIYSYNLLTTGFGSLPEIQKYLWRPLRAGAALVQCQKLGR